MSTFLTPITDPVVIDGTTQDEVRPWRVGQWSVIGRRRHVRTGAERHHPPGRSSTIRGLVVQNFGDDGIEIEIAGGDTIIGNYIGTDVTGTLIEATVGRGRQDLRQRDRWHRHRRPQHHRRRHDYGLSSYNGATGNVILGNHIGVDVDGDPLGNGSHGIELAGATAGNIVGGTEPAAGT